MIINEEILINKLKGIKNYKDLQEIISLTIENNYNMLFLKDRYCPNIKTKDYDIEVDKITDSIIISSCGINTYKRNYKNFYKSFRFEKADVVGYNVETNENYYEYIKYNLFIY